MNAQRFNVSIENPVALNIARTLSQSFRVLLASLFVLCFSLSAFAQSPPGGGGPGLPGGGGGPGGGPSFVVEDFVLMSINYSHGTIYEFHYEMLKTYDGPDIPKAYGKHGGLTSDYFDIPPEKLTAGLHTILVDLGGVHGYFGAWFVFLEKIIAPGHWDGKYYAIEIDEFGVITWENEDYSIAGPVSIGQVVNEPCDCDTCDNPFDAKIAPRVSQGASVVPSILKHQLPTIQLPNALSGGGGPGCTSCSGSPDYTSSLLDPSFVVAPHMQIAMGAGGALDKYASNAYLIEHHDNGIMVRFFIAGRESGYTYQDINVDNPNPDGILHGNIPVFKEVKVDAPTLAGVSTLTVTEFDGTSYIFSMYETHGDDREQLRDLNGRLASITTPNGRDISVSYGGTDPAAWTTVSDVFGYAIVATRGPYVAGFQAITRLDISGVIYDLTYANNAIETITGYNWEWKNEVSFDTTTQTVNWEITSVDHGKRTYRFLPDYLVHKSEILAQPSGFLVSIHDCDDNHVFSVYPNPANPLPGGNEFVLYWGDERKVAVYKVGESIHYMKQVIVTPGPDGVLDWQSFDLNHNELCHATNLFALLPGQPNPNVTRWMLGAPTSTVDEIGRRFLYEYDDDWFVTKRTHLNDTHDDSDDSFEEYTYNPYHQLLTYLDTRGNTTTYEYSLNNMTRMTVGGVGGAGVPVAPIGVYENSYGPAGQVSVARDALYPTSPADTHLTEWEFDANKRIILRREAADETGGPRPETTVTYHDYGGLELVTDPEGRETAFSYDLAGRRFKTQYNDDSTNFLTIGASGTADVGRLIKSKDRVGATALLEYDGCGRNWKSTANYETQDLNGVTLAVTDLLDRSWTERFYLTGSRIIEHQIENGRKSEYLYDYRDRVVETKSFPYAGKELIAKIVYECNQIFYTEDPYGRRNYSAYSVWDPTKKIRNIQCLYPEIGFADLHAVIDADRASYPKCLITDLIQDDEGNLVETIDPRGVISTVKYDTRNQPVESLAAAGTAVERKSEIAYDANGNVVETRSPRYFDANDTNGYQKTSTTMSYNGRNLVSSSTVAPGSSVAATVYQTYYLDGRGKLGTDAAGKTWKTYYHDCCGRLLGSKDPLGEGGLSNNDYEGRVTHTATVEDYDSHTNSHNPVNALTYGETTTRYDGLGRARATTQWLVEQGQIDPNNVPIAGLDGVSGNDGLTSQMYYDSNLADGVGLDGTGVSVPKLDGTGSYSLDVSGVLSKLLAVTGISFTPNESSGIAVVSINGEEEISVAISDGLGRSVISAQLQPHDGSSPFSLTSWGCGKHDMIATLGTDDVLETWSINGAGNTVKALTDGGGRTLQSIVVVAGADQITEMTYDPSGNLLTSTDPNGVGLSAAVYDELGQRLSQTDSYGIQTSASYDYNGNVVNSTDAKGKTAFVEYDARDRTSITTDRISAATVYTYRPTGETLTITDAEGKTTTWEYSDRGEKTRVTHPDHIGGTVAGDSGYGIVEFAYDPAGRLLRRTDQNGDTVTLNYDLASRMTSKDYRLKANSPGGSITDSDSFTHDAASRILTAESQRYNNIVTRSYDDGGRLGSESTAIDNQNYTVSNGYNSANQQTSITYPDGTLVARSYNDRGQLAQVQYDGNVVDTRVYDAGGRLDTSTFANGVVSNYDYRDDANGKDNMISQIATTNPGTQKIGTYAYTYDANRNKSTETISGAGFMSGYSLSSSTYDDDDRLTESHRADLARDQFWTLSAVGNWNTHKVEAPTRTFAHSGAHEIDSIDGVSITHDARGNVKQIPASISASGDPLEFTLDMDNRMNGLDTDGDGNLNKQARYDAFGRRVKFGGMGSPFTFIYSGQQLICRYGNGANPNSPKLKWVYGSYVDEPIMLDRKVGSVWSHFFNHRDYRYSIVAQTDEDGHVVERCAYDSHGDTRIMTASGTKRNSPAFNNSFFYTGRYYHAEPEFYYFRARLYSPSLGRFLSRDPLGFVDGMSLYRGYFAANGLDPSGQCEDLWGSICGAAKRCDQFSGQMTTFMWTGSWVDPCVASGLVIANDQWRGATDGAVVMGDHATFGCTRLNVRSARVQREAFECGDIITQVGFGGGKVGVDAAGMLVGGGIFKKCAETSKYCRSIQAWYSTSGTAKDVVLCGKIMGGTTLPALSVANATICAQNGDYISATHSAGHAVIGVCGLTETLGARCTFPTNRVNITHPYDPGFNRLPTQNGRFEILGHGNPYSLEGRNACDLVRLARNNGHVPHQPIVLSSCNVGNCSGSLKPPIQQIGRLFGRSSLASQVSNKANCLVFAPDKYLLYPSGKVVDLIKRPGPFEIPTYRFLSPNPYPYGRYQPFYPQGAYTPWHAFSIRAHVECNDQ